MYVIDFKNAYDWVELTFLFVKSLETMLILNWYNLNKLNLLTNQVLTSNTKTTI